jgi:hypothetical protein
MCSRGVALVGSSSKVARGKYNLSKEATFSLCRYKIEKLIELSFSSYFNKNLIKCFS